MAKSTSASKAGVLALALFMAAPVVAQDLTPYREGAVFGRLVTYVRLWEDVSPQDRAATGLRVPVLQLVHVGSRNTGVDGLTVEAMGFGEIDAVEPLFDPRGRADLLLATVTWRGLPNGALTVRGGRQLVTAGVANNSIIDGLYVLGRLPLGFTVEAWGGISAEPQFENDVSHWQTGARLAWQALGYGHLAASYVHARRFGEVAREVVGVDFSWRQIRWLRAGGYALIDLVDSDLADLDISLSSSPDKAWRADLSYRRYDPDARLAKTSLFSVFNNRHYDRIGGSLAWYSESMVSVRASGSAIIYEDGTLGMRATLRPRLVFNRQAGDMLGLEGSRVGSDINGYWSTRLLGAYRPIDWMRLAADVEMAIHDNSESEDRDLTDRLSTVARLNLGFELTSGIRLHGDVSVTTSPYVKQEWIGIIRFEWDPSFRTRRDGVMR